MQKEAESEVVVVKSNAVAVVSVVADVPSEVIEVLVVGACRRSEFEAVMIVSVVADAVADIVPYVVADVFVSCLSVQLEAQELAFEERSAHGRQAVRDLEVRAGPALLRNWCSLHHPPSPHTSALLCAPPPSALTMGSSCRLCAQPVVQALLFSLGLRS